MLALALTVALAAAPAYKLATPGLSYANFDEKTGAAFLDYFAQQIASSGQIQVTTPAEMASVVGLERQRQLLACSESSNSCLAELAGALGADGVITGSLARIGKGFLVNIKIISTKDAHSLAIFSTRVRDEDALVDYLGESARKLVKILLPQGLVPPKEAAAPPPQAIAAPLPAPAPATPTEVAAQPPAGHDRAWIWPAGVGAAAVAGGAVLLGLAHSAGNQLQNGTASLQTMADVQTLRATGEGEQAAGIALGAAGVGALAVSGGMLVWTQRGNAPRDAWWMPVAAGAASAVVAGVLYGVAQSDASQLRSPSSQITSLDQAERIRSAGSMDQTASLVLAGAAVVGIGSGLALRWLGNDTTVAASASSTGAGLTVGGTF